MWSFNTAWSNFPITSGVYAIVNTLNGKKYVGSTKIKDAAIAMGNLANRSAINRCCLGSKRTAFGFKWKYKYN